MSLPPSHAQPLPTSSAKLLRPTSGLHRHLRMLQQGLRQAWVISLLLLLAVWAMLTWQTPAEDAQGVHWTSATLTDMRPAPHAAGLLAQPRPVTLPYSWKPNGLPPAGVGTYAMALNVAAPQAADSLANPWSLRFDRLSAAHRIWLNGKLLHSTLPRNGWLAQSVPQLLDVPGGMLVAGRNTLTVEVHCAAQGGLTQPVLAPKADLQRGFAVNQLLTRDLLLTLNIVCITFSLFAVMLWWLRRQEATAGLFGMLLVVGALRNCRYFAEGDLQLSANMESWLYFTAHVVTACLQGWFIMALVNKRWPALNRVLWAVLLGFPMIGLVALPWDPGLTHVRNILQGALILLLLPSLLVLLHHRSALQRHEVLGLGVGWGMVLLASIHDFAGGRMVGCVTFSFWLPWALPMATPGFAVMVVERIVSTFNEIAQVNQSLESKVTARTRELAEANAAKSHFLASASHDLRQPVAAIGLITDLLQSRLTDPALRGLTDRLTRAVNSMESLFKGLLDLSRLDSGTVEVQRCRVRLQGMLEAVAHHEMESAHPKGLSLRIRPTPAVVWTDPVLLEQMLRNLVGNAIRHTTRGGVLVGVRRRGTSWVLQVWDTGPGIAQSDQQRIFEAFVQLGNPARNASQGLGLGLAIVHRAATLLGHAVSLRSVPGRGSVFCVTLPGDTAAGSQECKVAEVPASAKQADTSPHLDNCRVLVVEDNLGLRDTLVNLLSSWGLRDVQSAHNLASVKALPARDWDLVLSDHRLGDGTGRCVVTHLRDRQPNLPAIILTGDTLPEQLTELARSGLPVLHKPFRSQELRAMLVNTLTARTERDDSA